MRGLYFIANDKMYDLVIAFLNSVRVFEPTLPICMIPFNQNSQMVESLSGEYGFSVWRDRLILDTCDEISLRFHTQVSGQYRKLAIWGGPFREFVYIDIDTVLLQPLGTIFQVLDSYDVITGVSNLRTIKKYVWLNNIESLRPELDTGYSANTGLIASRQSVFTLADINRNAIEAECLKYYMALECAEQPFLNYLIVMGGVRYSSLAQIRKVQQTKDIPKEVWAGMFNERILSLGALPQLVHWAGWWQRGQHLNSSTWRHFRYLRADC